MSRKKNVVKRSQMKDLETSREEDCQRLLHLEEKAKGLNLKTTGEEQLAVDYRRKNPNLDMVLLIMGPLCNLSMWGATGFSFRAL